VGGGGGGGGARGITHIFFSVGEKSGCFGRVFAIENNKIK
jgi:hypothetical protein